jgi:hypothetical protein
MASGRSVTKIAGSGSGSISQRHGSVDSDPQQKRHGSETLENTTEKINLFEIYLSPKSELFFLRQLKPLENKNL